MWFGRNRPFIGALRVVVHDTADLAQRIVTSIGSPAVACVDVRMRASAPPRGWFGHPNLASLRAVAAERDGSGCRIRIAVERPIDVAALLAAAYRMVEPVRGVSGTFVDALPSDATVFAGGVRDVFGNDVHTHLRRADRVIAAGDVPDIEAAERVEVGARGSWRVSGMPVVCAIDPAVHRPFHRPSDAAPHMATVPRTDWLTAAQVSELRASTAVSGTVSDVVHAQLHATGVLLADEIPAEDSPWSIAGRAFASKRRAYQRWSPNAVLEGWPTVSAVLVTHRLDHLAAIVDQLRAFDYPRLQVVIGLHGVEVRQVQPLLADFPHPVEIHTVDAATPFGAALQAVCERAGGEYLTKIDDDDIYAPTHIWDLVIAHRYSGAELVGKALDWIYLADDDITVFRPTYAAEKYGKFVAGGTLFLARATLDAIGGWRPVPKSVDLALIESVRRHGGVVYRTQGFGYTYVRRGGGHTAQVDNAHFRTKVSAEFPGRFQVQA